MENIEKDTSVLPMLRVMSNVLGQLNNQATILEQYTISDAMKMLFIENDIVGKVIKNLQDFK